jgi:hypothetical protein
VADDEAVRQVPAEHLIAANKKAVQDREAFGSADVTVSIVSARKKGPVRRGACYDAPSSCFGEHVGRRQRKSMAHRP